MTMINQKMGKYPFLIVNTEGSIKDGEHWWNILYIETKKLYHNRRQKKSVKNFKWHRKSD